MSSKIFLKKCISKLIISIISIICLFLSLNLAFASISFVPFVNYPLGSQAITVTNGDFDGDGDVDLAVGTRSSNRLVILMNNGSGVFTIDSTLMLANAEKPFFILSDDFDGDGDVDLAMSITPNTGGSVKFFINNGDGQFTNSLTIAVGESPRHMTSDDFDGDGDVDLAVANNISKDISILINNGQGVFSIDPTVQIGEIVHGIDSGDIDGDGDIDLFVTISPSAGSVGFIKNSGQAEFTLDSTVSVGSVPTSIVGADFDGDGDVDVATTNTFSDDVTVLTNSGNGSFVFNETLNVGLFPISIVAEDYDNDGDSDLVVVNAASNSLTILANNGTSDFTIDSTRDTGNNPLSITTGDLNGNGKKDLITSNEADQSISVLLNDTGINHPPVLGPIGNKTSPEGQLIQFTVTASDPDGDALTFSATNTPAGSVFDPNTGIFSWTPGFNDSGNYSDVEFTVTDDGDPIELDVELITITVGDVNRAPIFATIGTQEVIFDETLSFTVTASDPDGDGFALTASNTPSGATFDPITGIFIWTPSSSDAGIYTVSFFAVDNGVPSETGFIDVVITVGDELTPEEQAEEVVDTVVEFNLPNNVENSYLANLQKVSQFIEDGKINQALNQLQAFQNKLDQDLNHGGITQEEYDTLYAIAQNLIDDLTN